MTDRQKHIMRVALYKWRNELETDTKDIRKDLRSSNPTLSNELLTKMLQNRFKLLDEIDELIEEMEVENA